MWVHQALRDETDLIDERGRERNDAMCACEEDAIIIIVLAERTREISLISSRLVSLRVSRFHLYISIVYRMHLYNKQDLSM